MRQIRVPRPLGARIWHSVFVSFVYFVVPLLSILRGFAALRETLCMPSPLLSPMHSLLEHRLLYAILDAAWLGDHDPGAVAAQMVAGGVDLLQVRAKDAPDTTIIAMTRAALAPCRPAGVPVIVNDRPDLAVATGANGVHVGQDDLPVAEVRRIVGPDRIIGKSSHSLEQALQTKSTTV